MANLVDSSGLWRWSMVVLGEVWLLSVPAAVLIPNGLPSLLQTVLFFSLAIVGMFAFLALAERFEDLD